jgi:hypothetical protein
VPVVTAQAEAAQSHDERMMAVVVVVWKTVGEVGW